MKCHRKHRERAGRENRGPGACCRIRVKKSTLLHSKHLGLIFQTLMFISGSLDRKKWFICLFQCSETHVIKSLCHETYNKVLLVSFPVTPNPKKYVSFYIEVCCKNFWEIITWPLDQHHSCPLFSPSPKFMTSFFFHNAHTHHGWSFGIGQPMQEAPPWRNYFIKINRT